MLGIDRMMERTFEAGLSASQTMSASAADCPYDERLAPNLKGVWLYGFISGRTRRPCRRTLRLN